MAGTNEWAIASSCISSGACNCLSFPSAFLRTQRLMLAHGMFSCALASVGRQQKGVIARLATGARMREVARMGMAAAAAAPAYRPALLLRRSHSAAAKIRATSRGSFESLRFSMRDTYQEKSFFLGLAGSKCQMSCARRGAFSQKVEGRRSLRRCASFIRCSLRSPTH